MSAALYTLAAAALLAAGGMFASHQHLATVHEHPHLAAPVTRLRPRDPDRLLVFVGGLQRSGTTALASALEALPNPTCLRLLDVSGNASITSAGVADAKRRCGPRLVVVIILRLVVDVVVGLVVFITIAAAWHGECSQRLWSALVISVGSACHPECSLWSSAQAAGESRQREQ